MYTATSMSAVQLQDGMDEYGVKGDNMDVYQLTGQTGSLLYMAPEVYSNRRYNEKVDVYSYGVILYELLTHELCYFALNARQEAGDLEDFADAVCTQGWRPTMPARVPLQLGELIQRCWAQDPSVRPTMAEVVVELKSFMASRGHPVAAPPELLDSGGDQVRACA
jgi:serine/threonine protein kinase